MPSNNDKSKTQVLRNRVTENETVKCSTCKKEISKKNITRHKKLHKKKSQQQQSNIKDLFSRIKSRDLHEDGAASSLETQDEPVASGSGEPPRTLIHALFF